MKIAYKENQFKLLRVCGVPKGLLRPSTINIKRCIQTHDEDSDPPISITFAKQIKTLDAIRKIPTPTGLFVFYSGRSYEQMRQYVVTQFWNNLHYCFKDLTVSKGVLPVWHYLDSGFKNELLHLLMEKDEQKQFTNYQPLLVVDGIHSSQGTNKNDKLRDIINLSGSHPVFILLSGKNPLEFLANDIGLFKPNFIRFESENSKERVL